PPRIITVDSRVWVHLGVNMWSRRPWSSGTRWWPRRRGHWLGRRGVRSWLHGGCCIPCWFAKWCWVLVDGPQRWIPSVGAFSWADSIGMGGLSWVLGCCRWRWP
ncbi:hypothetical protein K443DRAFT_117580, partial [Laccaria amethystina LaAM-08-1]